VAVEAVSEKFPATRPRRVDHAEGTRNALVQAASELFAERGYADTSLDEIVRRAGVTKGAMFQHFSSKEELLGVVLETVGSRKLGFIGMGHSGRGDLSERVKDLRRELAAEKLDKMPDERRSTEG